MAIVLIVSRTQMANGICVGGINEDTCKLIRIHDDRGRNLALDAPYQIGDRWEMFVEKAWNARLLPHVEDMQTTPIRKINNVGYVGIVNYIKTHSFGQQFICGKLQNTFEGCLHLNGTQNFINKERIPSFSTQFWIADKDLIHKEFYGKHYYVYNNDANILQTFTIAEFKKNISLGHDILIKQNIHTGQLYMVYGINQRGAVNGAEVPKHPVISLIQDEGGQSYIVHEEGNLCKKEIRIKFVGYQDVVDRIPQDTIMRLSLANWWDKNGSDENRCYLQLSGWYI